MIKTLNNPVRIGDYMLEQDKLYLSGWLKANNPSEYNSSLKLQKFLFLYTMFQVANNEEANFNCLRGYKNGPVYSDVWGAYTQDRDNFDLKVVESYNNSKELINEKRARKLAFIVSSLNNNDLSSLTHKLNIWKSKRDRIESGEKQISLSKNDITADDIRIIKELDNMYPDEMVENSRILGINQYNFILSKKDYKNLTEEHVDNLYMLTLIEELNNPVYVEIDEDGSLNVD